MKIRRLGNQDEVWLGAKVAFIKDRKSDGHVIGSKSYWQHRREI